MREHLLALCLAILAAVPMICAAFALAHARSKSRPPQGDEHEGGVW